MKKFICAILIMLSFCSSFAVSALTAEEETEKIYNEQFESSGLSQIYDGLPPDTRNWLSSIGITPETGELPQLSTDGVWEYIVGILKNGLKTPLKVCSALIGLLILLSLTTSLVGDKNYFPAAELAGSLCVAATVLISLYNSLLSAVSVLKSSAAFMSALVPIYCAILVASGLGTTGSTASAMLLAACQAVTQLASFGLAPIMGMYLSLSISASVSPLPSVGNLAELIKKAANWALSAVLTIFLGVLSLQTGITASADTLSIKAARYLAGSIPLVGGAVGETISVVKGSLSLLKTSAFGYGVIGVGAVLLPVVSELAVWRLGLNICAAVCGILKINKLEGLVRSCDAVFAFILGIAIYVGLLFIISLSIVSSASGGVAV